MDEPDPRQVEANATTRFRSQMKWGLIVFEVLLLWMLLNYTFLVPGDWDRSRESLLFGLGGAASFCACSSALVAGRESNIVRRLARMVVAPQFIVLALIMIPILLAAFSHATR
jgi:hypothetical protein